MILFEVKARYEKTLENGEQKKVTEPYIVSAMSCTEAEAKVIEELKAYVGGELEVNAVKAAGYDEVFSDFDGETFYKVKIWMYMINEVNGFQKKTPCTYLVKAEDFKTAYDNFMTAMEGTMADYAVASISETNIVDCLINE